MHLHYWCKVDVKNPFSPHENQLIFVDHVNSQRFTTCQRACITQVSLVTALVSNIWLKSIQSIFLHHLKTPDNCWFLQRKGLTFLSAGPGVKHLFTVFSSLFLKFEQTLLILKIQVFPFLDWTLKNDEMPKS